MLSQHKKAQNVPVRAKEPLSSALRARQRNGRICSNAGEKILVAPAIGA
jgi:hypothetical protein